MTTTNTRVNYMASALAQIARNERKHFPFIESIEDRDILLQVIDGALNKNPTSLKVLINNSIGSQATIERRLKRLRDLGMVASQPSRDDRRIFNLVVGKSLKPLLKRYFQDQSAVALKEPTW